MEGRWKRGGNGSNGRWKEGGNGLDGTVSTERGKGLGGGNERGDRARRDGREGEMGGMGDGMEGEMEGMEHCCSESLRRVWQLSHSVDDVDGI